MGQEPTAVTAADADVDTSVLEKAYRDALTLFKADKTNKDLRRARTVAKKAWDEAVLNNCKDTGAKQLRCRDCSQMFLWTTEDQDYYKAAERSWSHEPQRCRGCAESQKVRRSSNNENGNEHRAGKNMCYAFQRGECPYGDNCKFNHDPEFAGKKKRDEQPTVGSNDSDGRALGSGGGNSGKHDVGVSGASPVPTTNRNDSRDETKTGEGVKRTTTAPTSSSSTPAPSRKKPKVVGICKWGKNCKLKRCRFKHEDDNDDSSAPWEPLPFGNERAIVCVKAGNSASSADPPKIAPASAASSTPSAKDDEQQRKPKSNKKIDKLVQKAMAKALRKAPKKKLRVKELRKLVKKKMGSLGKDEIKVVVKKAIAKNKDSMALLEDGTVVKLLVASSVK